MKILATIASLFFLKVSVLTDSAHQRDTPLSLIFQKSLVDQIHLTSQIQICIDQSREDPLDSVRGGFKLGDKLTPFILILSPQVDLQFIKVESSTALDQENQHPMFNQWKCFVTTKIPESAPNEHKWVSESTDKSEVEMLSCVGTYCRLMDHSNPFSVDVISLETMSDDISFCKLHNHLMLFTSSQQGSNLQIFRQQSIATNRRRILDSIGFIDTDVGNQLDVSGATIDVTLLCGGVSVRSCMKQCPGRPYALFETNTGHCTECFAPGFVRWDDHMTCQPCNQDNNGVTIGHFYHGSQCHRCDPRCQTCQGPTPGECGQCWGNQLGSWVTRGLLETAGGDLPASPSCDSLLTPAGCPFGCKLCLLADRNFCAEVDNAGPEFTLTEAHALTVCDVNNGFYRYQEGQVCASCLPGCRLCTSRMDCQECDADRYFDESSLSCVGGCPDGTFQEDVPVRRCRRCHPSCLTCAGEFDDMCRTCANGVYRQLQANNTDIGRCVATCSGPGPFYTNNFVCTPCVPGCSDCSMSYCTSCTYPNYLYNDNHCGPCNEAGYTTSGINCQPSSCTSNCLTCTATPSECLSCPPDLYHSPANLTCSDCTGDWIFRIDGPPKTCGNCTANCRTCTGAGSSDCTACDAGTYWGYSSNGTGENFGYGLVNGACVECHQADNKYLSNGDCLTCPSGQRSTGTSCTSCPSHCTSCDYNGYCSSCESGFFPDPYNSNNCIECGPGKFQYNGYCYDCGSNCQNCTSMSGCDTCVSGFIQDTTNSSNCVTNCPPGQYNSSGTCYPCGSNCQNCTSSSYCDTCNMSFDRDPMNQFHCIQPSCPPGQYNSSGTCYPCGSNCQNCTSSSYCDTCNMSFDRDPMNQFHCIQPSCPPGQYNSSGTCYPCGSNCQNCTSSSYCDTCNMSFDRDPMNQFHCIQPSCPPGQYNSSGTCYPCGSNCQNCTSSSYCDTCNMSFDRDPMNQFHCIQPSCPPGQYNSSGTCYPCGSNCDICTSGTQCDTCASNTYRLSTSPTTCVPCTAGYYLDIYSDCHACAVSNCITCTNAGTCAVCDSPFQATTSGQCVDCGPGSYLSGEVCIDCDDSSCISCTGPAQCSACQPGYSVFVNICLLCNLANCAQCSSEQWCQMCDAGFHVNSGGACDPNTCSPGFYSTGQECNQCTSPCKECSGSATTCTACIANHGLQADSTCVQCTDVQFRANDHSPCQNCLPNCKTCQNTGSTCTSCLSPYIFSSSSCSTSCGANQFWTDTAGGSCTNCPIECASCTSATICTNCIY
jgi:hypothetical protein